MNKIEMTRQTSKNGDGSISFASLLDEYEHRIPRQGEYLQGQVLGIERDVIYVDVGAKRDAIISFKELDQLQDQEIIKNISRGDKVPVYVTNIPFGDEELRVSLKRGLEHHDWERAKVCEEEDALLNLEISGHNKGGLLVSFGYLEAFVPNSHMPSLRNYLYDSQELTRQKAKMVGDTLPVKMLEVDMSRKRLVMSAKAAEKEQRLEQLRALEEGQIVTGQVDNLVNYGAFVNIGYITGLLHISEIAWQQLEHPSEMLEVGEEVEVRIERIDVARERVSLSRKVLLPSPWEQFDNQYKVGQLIEGQLTGLVDFGAFVTLPFGIEGLVHISEINLPVDAALTEVLQIGERVLVRIINIDPEDERIGLSLRRVSATEEIEWLAGKQQVEAEEVIS